MINNNTQRDREKDAASHLAFASVSGSLTRLTCKRQSGSDFRRLAETNLCAKVRDDDTLSPTRETRALPEHCGGASRRVLCSASSRRLQASSLRSPDGRVPIQRNSDVKFSVSFVFFV